MLDSCLNGVMAKFKMLFDRNTIEHTHATKRFHGAVAQSRDDHMPTMSNRQFDHLINRECCAGIYVSGMRKILHNDIKVRCRLRITPCQIPGRSIRE